MEAFLSEYEFLQRRAALIGKKYPVLSHGYVELLDTMGTDQRIVDAARTTSAKEGKTESDDRNLIRYLMRHRHTTPTEMVELQFKVAVPMDTWRQWVRHRMASINEFSSRYSEVPDINDTTKPGEWRLQSDSNRQGSSGEFVTVYPTESDLPQSKMEKTWRETGQPAGSYLTAREEQLHKLQREIYQERIAFGVAKEQARKDLCLSQYTEAYWKIDMHNLLHFLGLRMDSHAQYEIRQYANAIGDILSQLYPVTWHAFLDYRFNAVTLTALDQQVIASMASVGGSCPTPWPKELFMEAQHLDWTGLKKCRERDECWNKLVKLGLCRE